MYTEWDYQASLCHSNLYSDELYHHGILGQRWGIRRYQNPDGTLTEAGRKRYLDANSSGDKSHNYEKMAKKMSRIINPRLPELKKVAMDVNEAERELQDKYDAIKNSKEFKALEKRLARQNYKQSYWDDDDYDSFEDYLKDALNPNSYNYIWDEDEPYRYIMNDKSLAKHKKEFIKAQNKAYDANDRFNERTLAIASDITGKYADEKNGPYQTYKYQLDNYITAAAKKHYKLKYANTVD